MTPEQVKQLQPGLYLVHWTDGTSSLAAVGITDGGSRWLAPTNWSQSWGNPRIWLSVDTISLLVCKDNRGRLYLGPQDTAEG